MGRAVLKLSCVEIGNFCKFLYLDSPKQLYKDFNVYLQTIVDIRDIFVIFEEFDKKSTFVKFVCENVCIKYDKNMRIRSKNFVTAFKNDKMSIYCDDNFLFNAHYRTGIFKVEFNYESNQVFMALNGLHLDLEKLFLNLKTHKITESKYYCNRTSCIDTIQEYYIKILDFSKNNSLICDIGNTCIYNVNSSFFKEKVPTLQFKKYFHLSLRKIQFRQNSINGKLAIENSDDVFYNFTSFNNQLKARFMIDLFVDSISITKGFCTFKDYKFKLRDCNIYKVFSIENEISFSLRSTKLFTKTGSFMVSNMILRNRNIKIDTVQFVSNRSLDCMQEVLYDLFNYFNFENSSKSFDIVMSVETFTLSFQNYFFSFDKFVYNVDHCKGRIKISDKDENIEKRNVVNMNLKDFKSKNNKFYIIILVGGRTCMFFLENLYRTYINITKKYFNLSKSNTVEDVTNSKFNFRFLLDFDFLQNNKLFYKIKSKGKLTYEMNNEFLYHENYTNLGLNSFKGISITTKKSSQSNKTKTIVVNGDKICFKIKYLLIEDLFSSCISDINFDVLLASKDKIIVTGDVGTCDININCKKFKFLYDRYLSDEGNMNFDIIFKVERIYLYHDKMIIYKMDNFNLIYKDYLSIKYNDVKLKKFQIKEQDFIEVSNLILDYKLIEKVFDFEKESKLDFDVYRMFFIYNSDNFLFKRYVASLYNCAFKYKGLTVRFNHLSYKNNSIKTLLESYINNDYIVDETFIYVEYKKNSFVFKSDISLNISNKILNNILKSDVETYRNYNRNLVVDNYTSYALVHDPKDIKNIDKTIFYNKKENVIYINNQSIDIRNLNSIDFCNINNAIFIIELRDNSIHIYNNIIVVNNTNFSFDFISQNEITSVSNFNQLPKIIKVENFLKYKKNTEFNIIRYQDCDLGVEITKKSDKMYDIYIITIYTFNVIEYGFKDDIIMNNIKYSRNKNRLVNVPSADYLDFFSFKDYNEKEGNFQQNVFKKKHHKNNTKDYKEYEYEIYVDRVYSKYSPEDICLETNEKCYILNDKTEKIRVVNSNLKISKVKNVCLEILDYNLFYSKMNYFRIDYFYSVTNFCDQDIFIGSVCIKSNSVRNLISSINDKFKICSLETSIPKKDGIVTLNEDCVNGYKEIDVLKLCSKRNRVFNLIFEFKERDVFIKYENIFVNNTEHNILVASDNKGVMILPNSSSHLHHFPTTKHFQFSLPYETDDIIELPFSGYRKKCFRFDLKDSLNMEDKMIFSVVRSIDGYQKKYVFQKETEAPYKIINNTNHKVSFNQKNVDRVYLIDRKCSYVLDNCTYEPLIEVKIQDDTIDVDLEDIYISKGKRFSAIVKKEHNHKLIEIVSNDFFVTTTSDYSKICCDQRISFFYNFQKINVNFFNDTNDEISSLHISEVEISSTCLFDRLLNIYDNSITLSVGNVQMDNQKMTVKYPVIFYSTDMNIENFLYMNFKYFLSENMLTIREFNSVVGNFEINLEEDVCTEIYKIFKLPNRNEIKKELSKENIWKITESIYKKNGKNFNNLDKKHEDICGYGSISNIDFQTPLYLKVKNSSSSQLSFKANLLKKKSKNFTNSLFNYFINNISDFEINIDELRVDKLEGSIEEMSHIFINFYKNQIYKNLYKFINHLDFLGNIGGFSKSLSLGFKDLTSSKDISSTGLHIVKGTKSILKNTVYGISNSIGKISKSVGSSANLITFDRSFTESFEYNPYISDIYLHIPIKKNDSKNVELFVKGTEKLVESFYSGLVGIAKKPVKGSSDGIKGIILGLGKGVIGAVSKPVVGLSEFVTSFTEIIKTSLNSKSRLRIRYPIPKMESIIKYDLGLAESYYLFCHFIKTLPDEYFVDGSKGFYDVECILILTNRRLLLTSFHNIIDINIFDINVNSRNKKAFTVGEIVIYVDRPPFIDSLCNFILNTNF